MNIGARLQNGRMLVKPVQFLDNGFMAYVEACRRAGGKFDPESKGYLFPIEALPALKSHLTAANFKLHLDDTLQHTIAAKVDSLEETKERLLARIEKIEIESCTEIRPYQKDGALFLAMRDRAALLDQMGLGKSAQALIALPDNPIPPVIIICPAVAKGVWHREIERWRPDLSPTILSGKDGFRWPYGGEAVVMNYDILPDFDLVPPAVFAKLVEGTVLIADEAHLLKGWRTQRTQRFSALAEKIRGKNGRTWLLTGTPLMNRPPELWSLLQAAGLHNETFSSWSRFREIFGAYESAYGGLAWDTNPSPEAVEALKKTTLRRMRNDVLKDLPGKSYDTILVDIDAKTTKQLTLIEDAFLQQGITDIDQALRMAKSNGKIFAEISRARKLLATAKTAALLELVEQYEASETPLVVFSAHTNPIDLLAKRDGWVTITGATSDTERTSAIRRFQAGECKGIAGTIGAMGTAVTLTYGSHAIFVDVDWVPTNNDQAEDRLDRLGQTNKVSIIRLVAKNSQLDKRMTAVLTSKRKLIDRIVNAAAMRDGEEVQDLGASLNKTLSELDSL